MNALTISALEVKAATRCPRPAGLVLMALPVLFLLLAAAQKRSSAEVVATASAELGWPGPTSGSSGGPSRCDLEQIAVGGDEWKDGRGPRHRASAATPPGGLDELRVVLLVGRVLQIAATSMSISAVPAIRVDQ
jgi:hypothetical protein